MYEWVDHTGELALQIEAPDEAEVFADAVAAFHELLDDEAPGDAKSHAIDVTASDHPTLLAEFLAELVFLVETDDFVPARTSNVELSDHRLRATVEGRRGHPAHLVKAVTYHDLSFERTDRGWRATVVLDV